MKIISWNVNGIRAVWKKGFGEWFAAQEADVLCLQETKAHPSQLDAEVLNPQKYHSFFHSAEKKGYSGVAIFTKKEPDEVNYGLGLPEFDCEGRVMDVVFGDVHIISAYFPNSQDLGKRLPYKLAFCQAMLDHCDRLRANGKNVVLSGDYNIAHREIDLKNPKTNQKNAGFLPEERAWMDTFTEAGYVDIFRHFEPGPEHYTWWSYRANARARNIGWRIDYFCGNPEMKDRFKGMAHQTQVMGSDHCPIELRLR